MDPLADKILVCSAFIAFVGLGWIPGLDGCDHCCARTRHHRVAAAGGLQKCRPRRGRLWQTQDHFQIVAIISILVLKSYTEWGAPGAAIFGFTLFRGPWITRFEPLSIWVAVALTFISGALYLWRNRQLYLQDCDFFI